MRFMGITIVAAGVLALACGGPASAGAKKTSSYAVKVDGKGFQVNLYADGSVKVIVGGMVGPAPSFGLRDRMRRAVAEATKCEITDDFWLDGKLVGKLTCPPGVVPAGR
ncbi:hypothetical protein C8J24_3054 [Sphingomonas aerolata]|uniref:Uncharacterized protein n=1 Tax=Sphingomonas aerolata TaxID=185951 RepID=A0A2T4YN50_9SPHN|nr:hypothetical protein [Sphingomonas aerolata]PTM44842.1 hypothetical protein C8J24_3054 [Sphingomonas aerolata]